MIENPKQASGRLKPQLHLICPAADIEESLVMAHGAAKYGAWNWRKAGIVATDYISAIRRHLAAWMDGEDNDQESGLSHLAHARACLGIMLDADSIGNMEDDRPTNGQAAQLLRHFTKASGQPAAASGGGDDDINVGSVPRVAVPWGDDCVAGGTGDDPGASE